MSVLTEPSPPWILWFQGTRADAYEVAWRLSGDGTGTSARMLRGWKMRTVPTMFDEIAATMQFPDYFGENWAALDECLADLSWMPSKGYVMFVAGAEEVLADEAREKLSLLRDVLVRAAETWATAVSLGEQWDRPSVPFHVILQGPIDSLAGWDASLPTYRE